MAVGARHLATVAKTLVWRPAPDPEYADGDDASWAAVDWASKVRVVPVDGTDVQVMDTGEPDLPVLVWVHGLGGSWQNWLLAIPPFLGRYRCIAPDLPGFGGSPMPPGSISIQGYARTLDALLGALGVDRATWVGNSMGGFIGAEVALAFATRVERLVLVSAAGLSITEGRVNWPLLTGARVLQHLTPGPQSSRMERVATRPGLRRAAMGGVVRHPERLSVALAAELLRGGGRPGFLPALDALVSYRFAERLREISVPVLIVWGREDLLVPVADADRFERLIGPNAQKVIFEDTGHLPMVERPSRFVKVVERFLAGLPDPDRSVDGVQAR